MDSSYSDPSCAESVKVGGNLRLLRLLFAIMLLLCPAIASAAEKSDYTVFDYIIGFVAVDIIISIMWYLLKK